MNIRVKSILGKDLGKTVSILVGVHGNEMAGIEAVNEILPSLKIEKGKLNIIYCNLKAIDENKRFIETNLNRCFLKKQPEKIANSLEGRTAREIIPYLDESEMVLDLHASATKDAKPFVICSEKNVRYAKVLPAEIVSVNWDVFEPGSTDDYTNLQNKVGLSIECGYLNGEESKEIAKKAILNFLKLAGMIKEKCKRNDQKIIKILGLYKNKYGGFRKSREFRDFESLGKGEIVGRDGGKEVRMESDGFVLFVRDREKLGEECFLVAQSINVSGSIKYKNTQSSEKLEASN